LSLNVRDTVVDALRLASGVGTFELIDPTFSKLPAGWLLSLLISVVVTLILSYLFLNQSEVRFSFSDEVSRLTLTGPTADLRVSPHSRTTAYVLTSSWSGHGPFAEALLSLGLKKGGLTISVETQSTIANLVREKGDGTQPRREIKYAPSEVATDGIWTWSLVTISTEELPETAQLVGLRYRRRFKSVPWYLLCLFIHLEPDVTKFRLVGNTP